VHVHDLGGDDSSSSSSSSGGGGSSGGGSSRSSSSSSGSSSRGSNGSSGSSSSSMRLAEVSAIVKNVEPGRTAGWMRAHIGRQCHCRLRAYILGLDDAPSAMHLYKCSCRHASTTSTRHHSSTIGLRKAKAQVHFAYLCPPGGDACFTGALSMEAHDASL
jgi:hypothetical protein